MLTHYFEIKAIPHEELPQSAITSLAMQDLHLALKEFQGQIGLGFPCYQKQTINIGGSIRCFASQELLESLKLKLLDKNISDYVIYSDIHPLPQSIKGHVNYSRVQNKGSSDLKRTQKRMKQRGSSDEDIVRVLNLKAQRQKAISLPHVHMKSSSTGQQFLLMIKENQVKAKVDGAFNSYGLSNTATVPYF